VLAHRSAFPDFVRGVAARHQIVDAPGDTLGQGVELVAGHCRPGIFSSWNIIMP
jgi:hypothetical protein